EDDMQHGFYRPATYNVLRAALDERGLPSAWFHRIVGPGIVVQKGSAPPGTIDRTAVEGARNMPYDIPNLQVEWVNKDSGGPVVYGLTAALHGRITIERGRVVQSNFGDYPMLRIGEMPLVEVHILESGEKPGGIGQPGVPPLAPAVCNAIFALTGKRIRELP